jgi:hypothetical protein
LPAPAKTFRRLRYIHASKLLVHLIDALSSPGQVTFLRLRLSLLFIFGFSVLAIPPDAPGPDAADPIVDRYLEAAHRQESRLNGASMEVDIAAEVPKLHQKGHLRALRKISQIGRITYDALRFEGDRSIKNEVIVRFLNTEAESREKPNDAIKITRQNYKFKHKGTMLFNGRTVHVLQLSPRKKRAGLFAGQIWIDDQTALPLRETGRFVKSPSIFLKNVEFVREFDIRNGISVPRRLESSVDTRLVGKALLSVAYGEVSLPEDFAAAEDSSGDQPARDVLP